jgi:4-O-beta-D-mannosyl-D-glucose phosphorylase
VTAHITLPKAFERQFEKLINRQEMDVARHNEPLPERALGGFLRYQYPVLDRESIPLAWRYDLNPETNPFLLERLGVNAVLNAGAIEWEGKILLVARIEGVDRKSFFAVAESESGIDGFRFHPRPIQILDADPAETNFYDMRLTRHEDGWVYGLFCTEKHDPESKNISAAVANCGIVRTKDFKNWERLPDLQHHSRQQRNVVLHPKFVNGKYFLYTRPMEFFMTAGSEGGLCWALTESMNPCLVTEQHTLDKQIYHTIKEGKLGAGAPPVETKRGWLHVAHAVRECASGMRYVLYAFLCDLQNPAKITHQPGGYLLAPLGAERVGDVSNVLFSNGLVAREDGRVFLYYASSDTRLHVATTTVDELLDYVTNTPGDGLRTHSCVAQRLDLIARNTELRGRHPLVDRALV